MTEAQRKQLEEMAEQTAKVYTGQYGDPAPATLRSMNFAFQAGFKAGATAAWEMATKAERERCAETVRTAYAGTKSEAIGTAIALLILNPPSEGRSE